MAESGTISTIDRKSNRGGPMAEVFLKGSESKYLAFKESFVALMTAGPGTTITFESRPTKDGDAYYMNNVKVTGGAVPPPEASATQGAQKKVVADRSDRIELQTFYKVAGMSGSCKTPEDVASFAKKLRECFERDLSGAADPTKG